MRTDTNDFNKPAISTTRSLIHIQQQRFYTLLCLLLITLSLAACASDSDSSTRALTVDYSDPQLESRLDTAFKQWVSDRGINGASIRLYSPDKFSWESSTGIVLLNEAAAFETNTKVRIGSATKPMTATVILQLIEEGNLSLDTRLSDFVDYPNGENITVEHLLRHRSGIYDVTLDDLTYISMVIADNGKWLTPEEVLGWTYGDTPINSLSTGELLAREAITTPGGNFHYSQPGYVSLGLMIETVTGQLLADVFAERIFTPLAMLDSRLASIDEPHDPVGYTNLFGNLDSKVATSSVVSSLNSTNSSAWSAGGVVSTSNDLVKFLPALLDGRLLSEESMQLMQDWQEASSNRFSTPDWHYGMGLSRTVRDGYVFVGHGGAVPGSGSVMQYIEDYDIYVIAVRNTDEDAVADGTPDLTEYVVQALLNNSQ